MHYVHWDVNHIIAHIAGPLSIRWYSLWFLAGVLLANYIFMKMAKKEGVPENVSEHLVVYVVFCLIIGARLAHCLFYNPSYYLSNPIRILMVWEGGLASHGGYLGVLVAIYLYLKRFQFLSFLWVADRVSIVAIMAGGFIRIGNLFNSEIYGRVTDVPWAFIFHKVDAVPRHPTQIYESIGYFSVAAIGYLFYRYKGRAPREGSLLGLSMILAFSFRTFIEFFKENQEAFEDGMWLNMGQVLSLPWILLGLFLFTGAFTKVPGLGFLTRKITEKPKRSRPSKS